MDDPSGDDGTETQCNTASHRLEQSHMNCRMHASWESLSGPWICIICVYAKAKIGPTHSSECHELYGSKK